MTSTDFFAILPLGFLLIWGMALLLVDLFIPAERKGLTAALAALGMAITIGLALSQSGHSLNAFNGMLSVDGFSIFLDILFLGSALAGVALAFDYNRRMGLERGEYYVLLIFTTAGMMLMAQAADLIVVFLALELLSIPLYVLAGIARPRLESEEASLKYFLLGSFSSGFVLYGIAMVYGATANTSLSGIVGSLESGTANLTLLLIGAGLILVGFGFKVAAVPFHMWTPDVYQGAPTPVTGFMSVGAKAAGFAALLRVFVVAFPSLAGILSPVAWVIAALTMIVGNVLAVSQTNIKRMLAYSSIAHAGYMLMAFASFGNGTATSDAIASTLSYLVAYALTSFGAWAVVIAMERSENKGLEIEDYAGLAKRYPILAAVMLLCMLSFAGMPPMLGFWGKFYLFRTAIEGGSVGLAVIGLLTSVVSVYYYLRVVVMMYMREGNPVARQETWINLAAVGSTALLVLLSLIPGPLFNWASQAWISQIVQAVAIR